MLPKGASAATAAIIEKFGEHVFVLVRGELEPYRQTGLKIAGSAAEDVSQDVPH